jgi:hypothetical protein
VIDVLHQARGAERVGLVEDLVADRAAMRQAGFRQRHAQPRYLVHWHQDLAAVALELVGYVHGVELLHDLAAVAQLEIAVQHRHPGRGDAGREKDEEGDHRQGHANDHGKTDWTEAAESLEQAVHCLLALEFACRRFRRRKTLAAIG